MDRMLHIYSQIVSNVPVSFEPIYDIFKAFLYEAEHISGQQLFQAKVGLHQFSIGKKRSKRLLPAKEILSFGFYENRRMKIKKK